MLKMDISKAFDSVQWPLLVEVLQHMGFGQRWRSLLCGILSTSTTKVMVNGEPGDTIYNCKGLRQGDPISPMLFILTMEPMQRMMQLAVTRGVMEPLARVGMEKRLSIFADDVVLFVKPNKVDLAACKCILELSGEASGLRINMQKSAVIPMRCSEEKITMACAELQ